MLQSTDIIREGFLCPQCHQDMSNMEMLQIHFRNVHMQQTPTSTKSWFALAKKKLTGIQGQSQNSIDPAKTYAQYFSFNPNDSYTTKQYGGYTRSHQEYFKNKRKDRMNQIFTQTQKILLYLELLTNTDKHIPSNGNSKERRKYEQGIVRWMDDSIVSTCTSCSQPFRLSRWKHHCRLDGSVICHQCSQFIAFSTARYFVASYSSLTSTTDEPSFQKSSDFKLITSPTIVSNGSNEDYLRMCRSCAHYLQNYYNRMCFKNIPKDEIFHHYENILQAKKEYKQFRPTYSAIIDSLLSGDSQYQLTDAQRAYRQLSTNYEKIDSISKMIAKLADRSQQVDGNNAISQQRYAALCRNIRAYAVQILQSFSISTKRLPTENDIKRAHDEKQRLDHERMIKLISNIPGLTHNSTEISEKLQTFIQQYEQVTQYIHKAKLGGRDDEVIILESSLRDLEEEMRTVQQT